MPRPSNKKERRDQIAKALMTVMTKKGYDCASMADVASEAGLAKGLIHYHFKNKQEILLEVLKDISSRHNKRLIDKLSRQSEAPLEQLNAFIDIHLSLKEFDLELLTCWVVLTGEALRKKRVRTAYNKSVENNNRILEEIIQRGLKDKIFNCPDVKTAASAITAAIQGYLVIAATTPNLIPAGSATQSVKLMAQGLLGSP